MSMLLFFRITSSGQDEEPVTDEDISSESENEEKKDDEEESEEEVTRHSEVQVKNTKFHSKTIDMWNLGFYHVAFQKKISLKRLNSLEFLDGALIEARS